jgi:hypothetical protein
MEASLRFEELVAWLIPLLMILAPIIIKWWSKREANDPFVHPNEARVKWRKFNKSKKIRPFSGWPISKTSTLRVTSDGIYCNGTAISLDSIENATVYYLKDHPFGKGLSSILRIETNDDIFDFSIAVFRLEKMELPFDVTKEETEIIPKLYSRVMIIGFVILVLIFILITIFLGN